MRRIVQLLGAAPRPRGAAPAHEIQRPELVNAGHRDVQRIADQREVPRRAERTRGPIGRAAQLPAGASESPDRARVERNRANGVIPGVGHVERVLAEREPLRAVELGHVPIRGAGRAGADDALDAHGESLLVEPAEQDAMVRRVGDGDAIVTDGDLPRKGEQAGRVGRRIGRMRDRPLAQRAVGAGFGQHALDEGRHGIGGELAGVHPDDGPARIDRHEGGPGADRVGAPHAELPVVQDGVIGGAEADGGVSNALAVALRGVLAAMNTDDRDGIGEALLDLPQLREDMDAVDSAIRPEVEQQQLPAEVAEGEPATAGVKPVEGVRKVGCADGRKGHPVGHGGRGAVVSGLADRPPDASGRTTCTSQARGLDQAHADMPSSLESSRELRLVGVCRPQ